MEYIFDNLKSDLAYILALQRRNRFDALVLDVIQKGLDQLLQTVLDWLQQSVQIF
jgi:hypothetical protein